MNPATQNAIANFIWGIADDVLRDVYVRGKYRDVILPMTVLRRLDCLLEPTIEVVLDEHAFLESQGIKDEDAALTKKTGYPFYNTSRFTFRRLLNEPGNIRANFEAYLDGFSENVQVIIEKFKLRDQIKTLHESDRLYALIQKYVSHDINLSPSPVVTREGVVVLPGLSNRDMGYVFEELIRRFNEENNEEAGEHFTPRDIIRLMANLIFLPIKDQIESTTYLVYDDACGSGGMLTEAEGFLQRLATDAGKRLVIELYGQEVNPETFAICQSDMLIKGRDPKNIRFGSTLANDQFRGMEFDFMLANPPYGKSWKIDQESLFGDKKKEVTDQRYSVSVPGEASTEKMPLLPRVSDGQLLFLVNMLSKMKRSTALGSRIAIVHNGSALFTGDAGSGESNIRRWIIENDWLEAIIGLPLNMFYNTGIATYIWVLSNRKPAARRGKVQLIDATQRFGKLRKNLGAKNCELTPDDIRAITELFLGFEETPDSKLFDNEDFGYWKITVERPLRLTTHVTPERLAAFQASGVEPRLVELAERLRDLTGGEPQRDWNAVQAQLEAEAKRAFFSLKKTDLKALRSAFAERDEAAEPVIEQQTRSGVITYEADPELRDTENVPLKERIDDYVAREVKPYAPDAWINREKTVKGYEISFTRYFYQFQPLRSLEDITADILALERETEGLLQRIVADTEATR